jgi:hypothetical protein
VMKGGCPEASRYVPTHFDHASWLNFDHLCAMHCPRVRNRETGRAAGAAKSFVSSKTTLAPVLLLCGSSFTTQFSLGEIDRIGGAVLAAARRGTSFL